MTIRFFAASPLLSLTAPIATTACYFCRTGAARRDGRGNFFAYLGLSKSPELNRAEVQRAYHNLQRRVHPDQANVQARRAQQQQREEEGEEKRHETAIFSFSPSSSSELAKGGAAAAREEEEVADVDESTYANASYETLRDPFLRCKYLMRLARAEEAKGAPLMPAEEEALMHDDDCRTIEENRRLVAGATGDISPSMEFLAEMMAENELIFGADVSEDEGRAQLQDVVARMGERYDECYRSAKACWERKDLRQFYCTVVEWTYVCNALRHAKDRLE